MSYQAALAFVLEREGGFVHDAADPGGATHRGITQRVYDRWRRTRGLDLRSVRECTTEETARIYEQEYWSPSWSDRVEEAGHGCLALCNMDWAVNAGVGRATRYLQLVCLTRPDGLWGPHTREAIAEVDQHAAVARYLDLRALHYWGRAGDEWARHELVRRGVPSVIVPEPNASQRKFLGGWLARLRAVARETGTPFSPRYLPGVHDAPQTPREAVA